MRHPSAAVIALAVCALASAGRVHAQIAPEGWVVLGVEEYRALRARATPPPPAPVTPPIDAALTRIDYDLRVEGDTVSGRALLTIDVLKNGWARVPIPAGVMVRNAALDGQRVSLVDGTPPYVLLSRAGRAALTLDIVVPIAQQAGSESFALPASAAPVSRVAIALPQSGIDLSVSGGFVAEHSESADGSRWVAYGRPNQPIAVSWKRKVDDRRASQPLRVRARITGLVALGEDVAQITCNVAIEVTQGIASEVMLAVPSGVIVNQVTGPTVADWEATSAGTLRVRLLDPSTTAVAFVVSGETRAPREGAIAVPLLRVPAAERETGGVAVEVMGAGEIRDRQARGFDPADPSDLGELVAGRESPSMVAFRMKPQAGTDARALTVTVVRYTPQAVLVANIEEARYRILAADTGWLLVEARYAVRNNQRSFLAVTLGRDAVVWSASTAGRPVRPGVAAPGQVLLPLEKGRAGDEAPTFVVEILYVRPIPAWSDKGRARFELPAIDLPISRTGVVFHHSPRFRVEAEPGAFRVDTDAGPSAAAFRELETRGVGGGASAGRPGAREDAALQALVDRFKDEAGAAGGIPGIVPVRVAFPEFGPFLFLASELTAESHAPAFELTYKQVKD